MSFHRVFFSHDINALGNLNLVITVPLRASNQLMYCRHALNKFDHKNVLQQLNIFNFIFFVKKASALFSY